MFLQWYLLHRRDSIRVKSSNPSFTNKAAKAHKSNKLLCIHSKSYTENFRDIHFEISQVKSSCSYSYHWRRKRKCKKSPPKKEREIAKKAPPAKFGGFQPFSLIIINIRWSEATRNNKVSKTGRVKAAVDKKACCLAY